MIAGADGGGPARAGRDDGHQQPAHLRGQRRSPGLRTAAHRLRVGHARARRRRLATGDPVVITRYLYKPDAAEGQHALQRQPAAATSSWWTWRRAARASSPTGSVRRALDRLVAGRRGDRLRLQPRARRRSASSTTICSPCAVADGTPAPPHRDRERRVPAPLVAGRARRIAYLGTRRGLTDLETTMEDTHVWVMSADGSDRRELGAASTTGRAPPAVVAGRPVASTSRCRSAATCGSTACPLDGGAPEVVVGDRGRGGRLGRRRQRGAWPTLHAARSDLAQLYLRVDGRRGAKRSPTSTPTSCGQGARHGRVVHLRQQRFKYEVEAFLTRPLGRDGGLEASADRR